MGKPVVLAWSGGKDSALALERLSADPEYEVVGLLTTVSVEFDRISIHGVRRELLARQAAAVGLPLLEAQLPPDPTNAIYEAIFADTVRAWCHLVPGLDTVAFGDLFLADIRAYRERQLAELHMQAVFPVWGIPTAPLAREIVARGYRATVVCLDPERVDPALAGAAFDAAFLDRLPASVDPCGERGEFHTFVTDGPSFRAPVRVQPGEVVRRAGCVFADLLPES